MKKILVPTDGSPHSFKAAEYAAEISKRFGAEVQLLNVIPPSTIDISSKREEKASLNILEKTKEIFDRVGVNVTLRKPERGHPAETICNIAKGEKFDLIVIGSRGSSLVEEEIFHLGGVSDNVSRHAGCPVLIVR